MQRIINKSDTFQILLDDNIDNYDYQYLFMLYQPIVGSKAINLYLTLLQEKELTQRINLEFNHNRLMLLLNFDTENELLTAFKQLELYNLIISYYYSTKSTYIYHLKKPLSAKKFFENLQLKTTLLNKIGSSQFERQKYYFTKHQPDISEDFINISNNKEIIKEQLPSKINLQQLMTNLKNSQKQEVTINPIISPKINSKFKEINLKVNLETKKPVKIDNKNVLNQTLSFMQEKKPEEYLVYLTKKPVDNKLKNTLKLLSQDFYLNNEVINCLLEYVWFKNAKRIEPNYILKIAKTFYENKINNIKDALNHLKLAYLKSKKHSYSKTYQQDVLWTNDYSDLNTNNNQTNDNTMSEKEISSILEEFDKY